MNVLTLNQCKICIQKIQSKNATVNPALGQKETNPTAGLYINLLYAGLFPPIYGSNIIIYKL